MNADDVRKMVDSVFDKLSPAKAQEMARGLVGEGRREQAQKLAVDLVESAQRNRERVKDLIAREVTSQVTNLGVARQADLDALAERVRDLERAAGTKAKKQKPAGEGKPPAAATKTATKSATKTPATTTPGSTSAPASRRD